MSETTGCDCAILCDRNEEARKSIKTKTGKESKDKSVLGKLDEVTGERNGEGTTVSSMCFDDGSGGEITVAHNNQKALANDDNGFVPGQTAEKRNTGESNLCEDEYGNKHKHDTPSMQKSGHTEARLLDELGKDGFPTSGTLTLKIDWRAAGEGGVSSPMPCRSCHKILCAAKACGVDVYLCDEGNQKQPITDEHCPADKPGSYEKLKETLQPSSISDVLG